MYPVRGPRLALLGISSAWGVSQEQISFTVDAAFGLIDVSAYLLGLPGEPCACDGGRLEFALPAVGEATGSLTR